MKLLALLPVAALLSACGAQAVQTSAGEMSAPSLGLGGLVMLAAVILLPLRRLRVAHQHRPVEPVVPGSGRAIGLAAAGAALAVSLCGLASIVMVAVVPRIIYTGYAGRST